MRLTTFLLFLCVFCSMAENSHSQNARINMNKNNVRLDDVLTEIESQTDYLFVYNNEVNANTRVTVKAKNKPVRDVLAGLFEDMDITYAMEGTNIVLTKKEQVSSPQVQQQAGKAVTGIVTDSKGEPLLGVSVGLKGTSTGTITDLEGKFTISVPHNESALVFSYLGYDTREVIIGNQQYLNIQLSENMLTLDEVVVVGYGTQKKANLSGAVQAVSGKEINNRPITNINSGYALTDWWKLGSTVAFVNSNYNSPSFLDGDFFWNVNRTRSLVVPKNPDGTWTSAGAGILGVLQEGGKKTNGINETQLSFNTAIDLVKNVWTLNADANFRWTNNTIATVNLPVSYRNGPNQPMQTFMSNIGSNSFARNESSSTRYTVYNVYTDFHKTFNEKHYLQLLGGYNQEYRYYNSFWVKKEQLISNNLPTVQLATGTLTSGNTINELALQGLFYRFNYIFDNKYIMEINGRYDGTSRYPQDDRWGFFPSGSLAWLVSNESFFSGITKSLKIDVLKLRGSYGALGNQNKLIYKDGVYYQDYYPYIPTMSSDNISLILDGAKPLAVYQPGVVSPDLTWEQVKTINGGIDLGLFNNKVDVVFDVYNRETEGMLTKSKTLPGVFGASEPQTNAADLETKGWELTLGWRDSFNAGGSPLSVSARFMIADSRSYITKYDNPDKLLGDKYDVNHYVGKEIGELWGFETEGFFQNQEELDSHPNQSKLGTDDQQYKFYVGDIKFKDMNNDGEISYGDNTVDKPGDRRIIGNSSARYPYSFELTSAWKGFDLRVFFQGVGKRDWYPNASDVYFWGIYAQPWTNVTVQNLDHWTPENPNAYFPRVKAYSAEDKGEELGAIQTRYLQDASYLRLKNLTVGYTLPNKLIQRIKLSNLRFYFSAENIFTMSHLKVSMDPEYLGGRGVYPFQKTYSFGVNLSF